MYILRPFMDEVSSEEIVKKDNEMGGDIPGGNFLGGDFPRGHLMGGNFLGGNFLGGNFPRTVLSQHSFLFLLNKDKNSWEYITMEI